MNLVKFKVVDIITCNTQRYTPKVGIYDKNLFNKKDAVLKLDIKKSEKLIFQPNIDKFIRKPNSQNYMQQFKFNIGNYNSKNLNINAREQSPQSPRSVESIDILSFAQNPVYMQQSRVDLKYYPQPTPSNKQNINVFTTYKPNNLNIYKMDKSIYNGIRKIISNYKKHNNISLKTQESQTTDQALKAAYLAHLKSGIAKSEVKKQITRFRAYISDRAQNTNILKL